MNTHVKVKPPAPVLTKFTKENAQKYVSGIADIWNTLDLDQMMQIFTEESRVEYIDKDPVVGLKAIRAMLADNFSNIATYELKKIARLAVEPEITTELDIKWTTKSEPHIQHRARCFEILRVENDKLTSWERSPNFRRHER
jgi:nuclear transport factor 2 (NTF2) superfamily protein